MTLRFQITRRLILLAGFLFCCGEAFAQPVLTDGFESGTSSNARGLTSGVVITNTTCKPTRIS